MPLRPIGACLSIPQGIFPNGLARRPQVGYGRSRSGKQSGALLRSNSARDTRIQGASMTREACGHFSRRPHSRPSSNAWAMPGKPRGSGGQSPQQLPTGRRMEKQAAKPPDASGSEAKPRWSLSPRNARTVRASFGTVMRPAKDRGFGNPSNPVRVDFRGINSDGQLWLRRV